MPRPLSRHALETRPPWAGAPRRRFQGWPVGDNGTVSPYDDDAGRPEPQPGSEPASQQPSDDTGASTPDRGLDDTQPVTGGSSSPPPLPHHPAPEQPTAPQQPAPWSHYGQQPTSSYPTQPQPGYGYQAPY